MGFHQENLEYDAGNYNWSRPVSSKKLLAHPSGKKDPLDILGSCA